MKKTKRIIAIVLSLTMTFAFYTPVHASELDTYSVDDTSTTSFIDAEGKLNSIYVTSTEAGTAHVEYYIDGVLDNSVDTVLLDSQNVPTSSASSMQNVQIEYYDHNSNLSETSIVELAEIDSFAELEQIPSISPLAANSFSYAGRINYNTYYDGFGIAYNDKLNIYTEAGTVTNAYRTINAEKGMAVSALVGVVASVLGVFLSPLASIATQLVYAAISSAGATVVGGIIQNAFSQRYYARITPYKVKARDVSTSRERTYDAERYQILLESGGYSSDYYYNGYLPWNSTAVAYWMFCDFWAYPYPGVSSYS